MANKNNALIFGRWHTQESLRSLMEACEHKPDCATSEKLGRLLAECYRRWNGVLARRVNHGYTEYKFIRDVRWENYLTMDIEKLGIAEPDPELLAAAGLAVEAVQSHSAGEEGAALPLVS